jgi:hypothetical protein
MHLAILPQPKATLRTHANIQKVCWYVKQREGSCGGLIQQMYPCFIPSDACNSRHVHYFFHLPGKSIGKHVFLSRAAVNASIGDQDANNAIKAKLLQLEANFYKASSLETDSSVPFLASYPGGGMLVPNQV